MVFAVVSNLWEQHINGGVYQILSNSIAVTGVRHHTARQDHPQALLASFYSAFYSLPLEDKEDGVDVI